MSDDVQDWEDRTGPWREEAEIEKLTAERDALLADRDEWHRVACEQLKTIDQLRAALARADKSLGSVGIKLSDAEAKLAADHCPTCMDNAHRLGDALIQLRELRDGLREVVKLMPEPFAGMVLTKLRKVTE